MQRYVFASHSETDTDRLGAALARILPGGSVIGLQGTLGAGKTRLVQAVAAAIGVPRQHVTSPTFVLCQEYQGQRKLYHLDAYRIHDDDEFLELGVDEYFASDAIVFVEWSDRVQDCLPPSRLDIVISVLPDHVRSFEIRDLREEPSELAKVAAELKR
jgi:tRNA threonylcarbamoyladenosine biosynthesis protein TsaE